MIASARHSMLRTLAANLLVLLAGIVASLLLLEGALRIYNPLETRIKGDRIVLVGNTRARFRNHAGAGLDPEITVSRNALGFRGPNPRADFAESLTLFTVGGSTTRCILQSDDKTWTAHLGQLLERSFRGVWINNAGIDGHTTYGHLVLLQDHIARLHPRVVLFLVGVNEIVVGPNNERDAENIRGPVRFTSFKTLLKTASAHSEVVSVGLDLYRSALAHSKGFGYQWANLAGLGDYDATEAQRLADREACAGPERLAEYRARLARLIAASRAAAIEPVFMTQPLLVGPVADDVTGRDLARIRVGSHRNGAMLWDLLETYNDVTRATCRDSAVFLIDLAREMPKSSRYYFDFMHFNNDGTALVAEIVHRSLCPHLASRFPQYVIGACPGPPSPPGGRAPGKAP